MKRLIWQFDFNEPENLDPDRIPMYWEPRRAEGFPPYAGGAFDVQVGHDAPPSFHLALDGRNVAFDYRGPHTEVRPGSEYLIQTWIRPDRLEFARAALSVYYLDSEGQPIADTQRFTDFVPNASALGADWTRVAVRADPAPPEAARIGLTVWVVQSELWRSGPRPRHSIERYDVVGGAWFDDIRIHRLPIIRFRSAAAGNLFVAPEVPTLLVTVSDERTSGLAAVVKVFDRDGKLVETLPVEPSDGAEVKAARVALGDLATGVYVARLEVRAHDNLLLTREVRLAQVAGLRRSNLAARAFGLTLGPPDGSEPADRLALISHSGVGAVKIPIWAGAAGGFDVLELREQYNRFLHELVKRRIALTGVLAGPPQALSYSAGAFPRGLVDVLSDDPTTWRDALTTVAVPLANILRSWQLGADGDRGTMNDPRLPATLQAIRDELKPVLNQVEMTAIGAVDAEAGPRMPADYATISIHQAIHPAWIAEHFEPHQHIGYRHLSAWIEPEAMDGMAREPGLAHWARRILHTRHAGAQTVYVPQLWESRRDADGVLLEPTDEYIVFRTIATLLAEAQPGDKAQFPNGTGTPIECLSFESDGTSTLALWDLSAPPEGRLHTVQLGAAAEQIDLWGRVTPLQRDPDGRHRIRLRPSPTLVPGVEPWIVALHRAATLTPGRLGFELGTQTLTLQIENPSNVSASAVVHLNLPDGWNAAPTQATVNLLAGRRTEVPIEVRYPANESAGQKDVLLRIDFTANRPYYVEIPARLDLGLDDVEVWGDAIVDGDRLVVRHGVTNRSQETLNLRSSAVVPARPRQSRVMIDLQPGQSARCEYRFSGADELSGRELRLGLRQINGTLTHNLDLTAP